MLGNDSRSDAEIMLDYGLTRSWHLTYIREAAEDHSFQNKAVLEIGGLLPRRYCLDYVGAKSWVNLNKEHFLHEDYPDEIIKHDVYSKEDVVNLNDFDPERPYQFINAGIEDIPEAFENKFDIVYSTATFEHVLDMGNCLERSWAALKPGGLLISIYAPIWSGPKGHHRGDKIPLTKGGTITIPDWLHLLYRPAEFYEKVSEVIGERDAGMITQGVYFDSNINRMFVEDYMHFVRLSKFSDKRFNLFGLAKCPDAIQAKLERIHPGRKHFSNSGISMVLRK